MQELIGALLDLARLSRRSLEREQVALGDMVRELISELEPELEGRNVDLVVMDLPPCSADPRLLRQVLANLLNNALKFSRGRSPARIEVGYVAEPDHFTYFVRDNGVGFDMRNADRLFGVFQRFHDSTEFEGTGVGLATVNRIVNRHGGRVWAEAAPDQGATLYFTLGA
jgi:signal transduction histidine kinase